MPSSIEFNPKRNKGVHGEGHTKTETHASTKAKGPSCRETCFTLSRPKIFVPSAEQYAVMVLLDVGRDESNSAYSPASFPPCAGSSLRLSLLLSYQQGWVVSCLPSLVVVLEGLLLAIDLAQFV